MSKVYVLTIENYDALDDYMTTLDAKAFLDKTACEKWLEKETKRQNKNGFHAVDYDTDRDHWEFNKDAIHGSYRHIFHGRYCEVIGGEQR